VYTTPIEGTEVPTDNVVVYCCICIIAINPAAVTTVLSDDVISDDWGTSLTVYPSASRKTRIPADDVALYDWVRLGKAIDASTVSCRIVSDTVMFYEQV